MMVYGGAVAVDEVVVSSPGSPPGMTASKSSKSSSFHSSFGDDDNGALADVSHFEDIGLGDDEPTFNPRLLHADSFKSGPNPLSPFYSSDLRAAAATATSKHASSSTSSLSTLRLQYSRDLAHRRSDTNAVGRRPSFPSLQDHMLSLNVRGGTGPGPIPGPQPNAAGAFTSQRYRSPSPNISLNPRHPNIPVRPRRSSWQSNRERKSAIELELECDEDDGDDIPEGLVLDNVPISPRPPQERAKSQPSSKSPSPERQPKERLRSVGNGTPPVAVARGSLRSPTWKSEASTVELSECSSPVKGRVKSWTAALADLNTEARVLTEKLEEHADEAEHKAQQRSSTGSMPLPRRSSSSTADLDGRPRVKSAIAELPPLRRTNIMIDPFPISREKEAVLSRTRPSWLPPKDPAEERRHLREYQKMMAQSAEADRRREKARRVRSECRDTAVSSLMHLWEDDILPRWNAAVRERRTRELWWRGVAPRSRGRIWARAIGNELGLTETSYQAALRRAHEAEARCRSASGSSEDLRTVESLDAIRKDVESRTWRDLRIFQAGGPLHQSLVDVLSAYAMYRSDVGYIRGSNTIAALLLLNLSSPTATFIALANVLNRSLPLSFLANDTGAKTSAYNLLLQTLANQSHALHDHLVSLPEHQPDAYLSSLFTSLFTSQLSLDEASRLWDIYVFEGDSVLVRAGVAFLGLKEMALLGCKTIDEVVVVVNGGDRAKGPRAVDRDGDEEKWITAVREAGRVSG